MSRYRNGRDDQKLVDKMFPKPEWDVCEALLKKYTELEKIFEDKQYDCSVVATRCHESAEKWGMFKEADEAGQNLMDAYHAVLDANLYILFDRYAKVPTLTNMPRYEDLDSFLMSLCDSEKDLRVTLYTFK